MVGPNPDRRNGELIDPQRYLEMAESIAAWLIYTREHTGVTVDYVSFNETDIGISLKLSPQEYAALAVVVGERLQKDGLSTRIVFSDYSNMLITSIMWSASFMTIFRLARKSFRPRRTD